MSKHEELTKSLRASAAAMPFDAAVAVQYRAAADALEAQAREIEGLRKQDDALILQLVEALEDLAVAGEEAWSEERPCVRIGKEAATAGRARLVALAIAGKPSGTPAHTDF